MSDMSVNMGGGGLISYAGGIDAEWQAIINKLKAYGRSSTRSKTRDRELLHSIELEKVKLESTVSSKFLTVSRNEQEKIIEKKKERQAEANPEQKVDMQTAAKVQGEQLYLAIQMKNKKKKV